MNRRKIVQLLTEPLSYTVIWKLVNSLNEKEFMGMQPLEWTIERIEGNTNKSLFQSGYSVTTFFRELEDKVKRQARMRQWYPPVDWNEYYKDCKLMEV